MVLAGKKQTCDQRRSIEDGEDGGEQNQDYIVLVSSRQSPMSAKRYPLSSKNRCRVVLHLTNNLVMTTTLTSEMAAMLMARTNFALSIWESSPPDPPVVARASTVAASSPEMTTRRARVPTRSATAPLKTMGAMRDKDRRSSFAPDRKRREPAQFETQNPRRPTSPARDEQC